MSNDIAKPGQDEGGYDKIPLKAAHSLSEFWKIVKADLAKVTQPLVLFHSAVDHVVEAVQRGVHPQRTSRRPTRRRSSSPSRTTSRRSTTTPR